MCGRATGGGRLPAQQQGVLVQSLTVPELGLWTGGGGYILYFIHLSGATMEKSCIFARCSVAMSRINHCDR